MSEEERAKALFHHHPVEATEQGIVVGKADRHNEFPEGL